MHNNRKVTQELKSNPTKAFILSNETPFRRRLPSRRILIDSFRKFKTQVIFFFTKTQYLKCHHQTQIRGGLQLQIQGGLLLKKKGRDLEYTPEEPQPLIFVNVKCLFHIFRTELWNSSSFLSRQIRSFQDVPQYLFEYRQQKMEFSAVEKLKFIRTVQIYDNLQQQSRYSPLRKHFPSQLQIGQSKRQIRGRLNLSPNIYSECGLDYFISHASVLRFIHPFPKSTGKRFMKNLRVQLFVAFLAGG